jgi:hypothetical protein
MNALEKRIRCGEVLLNREHPHWRETIDLSLFDMCSSSNGLLEQLYDSYAEGIHTLGLTHADGYEYGFDIRFESSDESNRRQWKALMEAWMPVIREQEGVSGE